MAYKIIKVCVWKSELLKYNTVLLMLELMLGEGASRKTWNNVDSPEKLGLSLNVCVVLKFYHLFPKTAFFNYSKLLLTKLRDQTTVFHAYVQLMLTIQILKN